MDFKSKGMKWVTTLRQKLETVCIEMEDKLCEDAKYVENQVQTVGINVNKFLTEVMQDILPSSCMSPVKEKSSELSVVQDADASIERKPSNNHLGVISSVGKDSCQSSCMTPVKEKSLELMEDADTSIETKPSVNELGLLSSVGKDSYRSTDSCEDSDVQNLTYLLPPSSLDPIRDAGSVKSLEKYVILEVSKPTNDEDHSLKNEKYALMPESVSPVMNQASLPISPQNSILLHPEPLLDPVEGVGDLPIEEDNDSKAGQEENTEIVKAYPPPASAVLAVLKDMSASSFFTELGDIYNEEAGLCLKQLPLTTSAGGAGREFSPQSEAVHDNVADADNCVSDVSSSFSSHDLDFQVLPCEGLEFGLPHSISILPTESEVIAGISDVNVVESSMEKVELFDNVKLGDSCVAVDNKGLLVSPRVGTHKSLKKILRHALYSRMRSAKQQGYEQLAILYGDIDRDSNLTRETSTCYTPLNELHLKKSSEDDSLDSDWELV